MKIAFIVTCFPLISETFIINQITGLIDLGHDVEIFARTNPNESKVHSAIDKYKLMERTHFFLGESISVKKLTLLLKALFLIPVYLFKNPLKTFKSINIFKYGKYTLFIFFLFSTISRLNKTFDIIHCHFGPNGMIGVGLKDLGISEKVVTTFHGVDVNSYPRVVGQDVYIELFRCADCLLVNSHFTKSKVLELGASEQKINVLPVGFNIAEFPITCKTYNYDEDIQLLTVGRLVEKKGHEYTIRALAQIVEKHRNIRYFIAGDGPLLNHLKSLTVELGIQDYVIFLGVLTKEEVLQYYVKAHIFVLSSVTAKDGDMEGQALVLQEAQASGIPVISTFHNGIPEGVLNGESGILVPEKDVDALVSALNVLIEHPKRWPEMGKIGRAFVEKKYDQKKLTKQLVAIYGRSKFLY